MSTADDQTSDAGALADVANVGGGTVRGGTAHVSHQPVRTSRKPAAIGPLRGSGAGSSARAHPRRPFLL